MAKVPFSGVCRGAGNYQLGSVVLIVKGSSTSDCQTTVALSCVMLVRLRTVQRTLLNGIDTVTWKLCPFVAWYGSVSAVFPLVKAKFSCMPVVSMPARVR